MNNVIHVNFKRKSLIEYNKQNSLYDKWNKVYQLDKLISERLSIDQLVQLQRLTPSRKFMDRAMAVSRVSKSLQLRTIAAQIIDLLNKIRLEQNTTEKVYTSNDIPF